MRNVQWYLELTYKKYKILFYGLSERTSSDWWNGFDIDDCCGRADCRRMNYEMDAIAVVVMGGTSMEGGKGNVLGTILGAMIAWNCSKWIKSIRGKCKLPTAFYWINYHDRNHNLVLIGRNNNMKKPRVASVGTLAVDYFCFLPKLLVEDGKTMAKRISNSSWRSTQGMSFLNYLL